MLAEAADARETPLGAADGGADRELCRHHGPGARRRRAGSRRCSAPHKIDLGDRRSTPSGAASNCSRRRASPPPDATFSAEFGRNLEYYTGFVFEISVPELGPRSPIAGGGRYDSLRRRRRRRRRRAGRRLVIHTERLLAVLSGAAP